MKRKRLQLLLALLITAAMGAWGKQIYISYPAWPSGTTSVSAGNLVLEMELSDSFENLKSKIEDKSGLNPTYMHLYYNGSECANTEILAQKGITEGSVLTLVYIPPYAVKLKDGTADAGNWTATVGTNSTAKPLPVGGLSNGDVVTLKYGGRLKVKNVTATHDGWNGDLSNIPASLIQDDGRTVIVPDGTTLKGTLNVSTTPYKVVIPAGATVTLDGVNISSSDYCISCLGDATIVLKDGTTNTLTSTSDQYPALWAGDANTTLTIKGSTGVLNVTSGEYIAGIGGGWSNTNSTCGNITIEGGVITAQGGYRAPGIGSDNSTRCGNITITNGVTKVTAKKGVDSDYSIGAGNGGNCGTIIIGCTLDTNGNPVGGTKYWENNAAVDSDAEDYLRQATIIYPEP